MPDVADGASAPEAAPEKERGRFASEARRITLRYTRLAVAVSLFGSTTPWIGEWFYLLERATSFVPIYTGLSAAALVILSALRSWRWSAVALVTFVLAGAQTVPCYLGKPSQNVEGAPLRVMTVNVFTANRNYAGLLALLKSERPDVVAVLEIDEVWAAALADLETEFPHRLVLPQEDNFGIGLFSKRPFEEITPVDLEGVPAVRAVVKVGDVPITVLAVHTLPPASPLYIQIANKQLDLLPKLMQEDENPVILLGDLNVTRWSPYFVDLLDVSGASDARQGYGVVGTWPSHLWPCLIPIDHCLYTPPLHVVDLRRGPRFGSDHLPLIIDLVVPGSATH